VLQQAIEKLNRYLYLGKQRLTQNILQYILLELMIGEKNKKSFA